MHPCLRASAGMLLWESPGWQGNKNKGGLCPPEAVDVMGNESHL